MKASTKVGLVLLICYLVAWLDRMAINMAMPFIAADLKLGPKEMGYVLSAFFASYAICQIPGGILSDKLGPRIVVLVALGWWTTFTVGTGVAMSLGMLLVTRFLFGIGEGLFPAAVWKVIGVWFTKKNRATANALVLSSIAIGPAITPIALRPVLQNYGWRTVFFVLGGIGALTVGLAWVFIHNSVKSFPGASAEEISAHDAEVAADDAVATAPGFAEPASFGDVLKLRSVWALAFTALAGNITMYGWLNWLPTYLMKVKGLDLKGMAIAASLPFFFGAIGLMASGWISDRFFRGRRKVLVLVCQVLGGLALYGFTQVEGKFEFMVCQCTAGFLLFMAVGAIWAMPMVILPAKLMGSGSGFINMGGQIGGFLTNIIIGFVIESSGGSYAAGFNVLFSGLFLGALCMLFGVPAERRAIAIPIAA